MRSRGIKPGFFKNEELAELPFEARLLFAGLWCMADREGRLEDRPKRIKAEIFPYDSVDVAKLLESLATSKHIRRYTVGIACIDIPTFKFHQNPHKNEKPSVLPAYGDIAKLPEDFVPKTEALGLTPSSLTPSSLTPDCGVSVDDRKRDPLTVLCLSELPASESTEEDYARTIERYRPKLSDAHIESIIAQLGNYRPKKPRPKLHLTLAQWLSKEPRDALPQAHTPFDDKYHDVPPGVPPPPEVDAFMQSLGRDMP